MNDTTTAARPVPARRHASLWREMLETAVLTVGIFLLVRGALQNFRVDGTSMVPTLHNQEYILVNKVDYLLESPRRGDIIVFRAVPALQPTRDFVKRIIGVPGDTVAVRGGRVYVNRHPLREPYISEAPNYVFGPRRVPKGDYFVLGDNRNDSYDSAKWTTTPWLARKYIIGKAWVAYWPPAEFTGFGTPSYTG